MIEDNRLGSQRISDISFDRIAGSLDDVFDFRAPVMRRALLGPVTGQCVSPKTATKK